jgi:hypothetical protein
MPVETRSPIKKAEHETESSTHQENNVEENFPQRHNMVPQREADDSDFVSADERGDTEEEIDWDSKETRELLISLLRERVLRKRGEAFSKRATPVPSAPKKAAQNGTESQVGGAIVGGSFRKLPALPTLKNFVSLPRHLKVCRRLLMDEGVDPNLYKAKVHVTETLSQFLDIYEMAQSGLEESWEVFEAVLLSAMDPGHIRQHLREKLAKLKFDYSDMHAFIREVRTIYLMKTADINHQWFIETVFDKLPRPVVKDVINSVRAIEPGADWMSQSFDVIIAHLTYAITTAAALDNVKPVVNKKNEPRDRVNRVESAEGDQSKGKWLPQWFNAHNGNIWHISPRTGGDQKLEKLRKDEGTIEIKQMRRQDKSKYYLAAFKSPEVATDVLSKHFAEGEFRPFKLFH